MRPRTSAGDRVRRLLAIIPWIAERDGPRVAEVCARFGLTRAQLLADLEVVFLVGAAPLHPRRAHRRRHRGRPGLDRPGCPEPSPGPCASRLSRASPWWRPASSLLATPGTDPDGPLARGLDKLARLLGIDEAEAVAITLGSARPEVLDVLRAGGRRAPPGATSTTTPTAGTARTERVRRARGSSSPTAASGTCRPGATWPGASACSGSTGCATPACGRPRFDRRRTRAAAPRRLPPRPPTTPGSCWSWPPQAAWVLEQYHHEEVEVPPATAGRRVRLPVSAGAVAGAARPAPRTGRPAGRGRPSAGGRPGSIGRGPGPRPLHRGPGPSG